MRLGVIMTTNFHISPKTNAPARCVAQNGCPIGGEHFADKESANVYAEKQLAEQHSVISSLKKSPRSEPKVDETPLQKRRREQKELYEASVVESKARLDEATSLLESIPEPRVDRTRRERLRREIEEFPDSPIARAKARIDEAAALINRGSSDMTKGEIRLDEHPGDRYRREEKAFDEAHVARTKAALDEVTALIEARTNSEKAEKIKDSLKASRSTGDTVVSYAQVVDNFKKVMGSMGSIFKRSRA